MIKPLLKTSFFIEIILYLKQTTRILHVCKGVACSIISCFDYPFISILDFPCHLLFPAFMLHDKALKIIHIYDS